MRRDPETYSAKRLHDMLVRDVVKNRATPLPWFISAIKAIASKTGVTVERAMLDLVEDCNSRGYPLHRWPMAKATNAELRAMGL